ncbi:MAG: barstar family protein [Candidatus Aquirickettsiella gammari]
MSLLSTVSPNAVQSIRAFRNLDLQTEAAATGQHFLYVHCGRAQNKQEVLSMIADSFGFPAYFGQNFDALYDCLTDSVHKAGQQNGFVVVIEHLPNTEHFDKELRETLLDVFRDAADYWAKKKISFRVFYSFE